MKSRKGLVVGLGLALGLQSVVVFANDVYSETTASTSEVTMTIEGTTEEPVAEAPVAEAPVVEAPVVGEPVAEEPVAEEPVVEEPVVEEPVVEEPVVEEPVVEEPVVEEPVVEEPVVEEPVVEEPVVEEPVVEEPVVEEPVVEEPVVEEPVAEEPVVEEPVAELPVAVEPLVEIVPEVKANATLLITNKLISDDGEFIFQEEITDLVAGTTVDIAEYVCQDEYVKAVNGSGTIELVEGQNEIVVEYNFVCDSEEESNDDTAEEECVGELMY